MIQIKYYIPSRPSPLSFHQPILYSNDSSPPTQHGAKKRKEN